MKKLTKKKKKIILMVVFWFIICLVFFALSALLILWAAGYKYNFATGKFHKTGLIYLKSEPAYVKVYLNGKLKTNKTPTTLSYLTPGNYQILIRKEGYYNWTKNVEVVAGKVKKYDNIILFLAKFDQNSIEISRKVNNFSPSPNKNKVLVCGLKTVIYDLKNRQIGQTIPLSGIKFSQWSPDSKKILLFRGNDYYIYDLSNQKIVKIKLVDKSNIKKIIWHSENSNKLYLLRKTILYSIDLKKNNTLLSSNISDLAAVENGLVYLIKINNQYFLEKSDFNFENRQRIINLNSDAYKIVAKNSDYFLIDSKKTLFTISENKLKKINSSVDLLTWSEPQSFWIWNKKNKILYKTELDGIYSYDLKDQTNNLIYRSSEPIKKIVWYPDLDHLLFLANSNIVIVESDGTNKITLARGSNFDLINEKELIYLDQGGTLKIIEIQK